MSDDRPRDHNHAKEELCTDECPVGKWRREYAELARQRMPDVVVLTGQVFGKGSHWDY